MAASDETPTGEGEQPVLAIGIYIGVLLALYGLILIFYGWLGSPDNSKSLGPRSTSGGGR